MSKTAKQLADQAVRDAINAGLSVLTNSQVAQFRRIYKDRNSLNGSDLHNAYDLVQRTVESNKRVVTKARETPPTPVSEDKRIESMRSALELIARREGGDTLCSTSTSLTSTCRSELSGRTRDALYGSESWCEACIAADALGVPVGENFDVSEL